MSILVKQILVCLFLGFVYSTMPQTPLLDDTDVRSWNELQIEVPLNDKVDLLLQTVVRFDKNVTGFADARVGAGLSLKVTKGLSISPSYQYFQARRSTRGFAAEHRYNLKATYKFPFKKFGLSHGSHYEYRVRGSGNLWRYRPSITVEKALPDRILRRSKVWVTEEPFYVSTTRRFSRNRISAGVSKRFGDHFSLDLYYLRQDDSSQVPGVLHVLGTKWKIRL